MLEVLEHMERIVAEIDRKVKEGVRNNEDAQLLMRRPRRRDTLTVVCRQADNTPVLKHGASG